MKAIIYFFISILLVIEYKLEAQSTIPDNFKKVWDNYSINSSFTCDVSYKSFSNNEWSDELKGQFSFNSQNQYYKIGRTSILSRNDQTFIIDHDNKQVMINNNKVGLWDMSNLKKLIDSKQVVFDCTKNSEIFIQSNDGLNIMSIQYNEEFKPIKIVVTTIDGISTPGEVKRNNILVIEYSNYRNLESKKEFESDEIAKYKNEKWILSETLKEYELIY
ncbi:MAG: hypothetical protein HOP11_07935 [Saprospiraceae bacterium]|nr:hypothetical protein [Saprospiraceae bacterium]